MYIVDTSDGKRDIFSISYGNDHPDPGIKQKPASTLNFLLAFTGRSGSTMLCSLLKQTGVLGQPDEYTNPRGPMQMYLSRLPAHNFIEYVDLLRRQYVSPNGVFGMKSSYLDYEPMLTAGLVGKCLDPIKFIYLTRVDLVLQAISFVKAKQTNIWHNYLDSASGIQQKGRMDLFYDENAILQEIDGLITQQHQWERFFSLYSIIPLRITYEDILEDAEALIGKIADFLGVSSVPRISLEMATTQKLGDSLSLDWARRIREKHQL